MAKLFLSIFCFSLPLIGLARPDIEFKNFQEKLNSNMQEVLEENPQMYEKKDIHRKPASVEKFEEDKTINKLDGIDEQADTHLSW